MSCTRLALITLAGTFLCANLGLAQYTNMPSFVPVKDTFVRYDAGITSTPWVTPGYTGVQSRCYGDTGYGRSGNSYQNRFIMDFDRAAILAAASATMGRPASYLDFSIGEFQMAFTVTYRVDAPDYTYFCHYPAYFTSTTAWTRENNATYNFADGTENGDGSDWTLWNGGVNDSGSGLMPRNHGASTRTIMDCPTYYDPNSGIYWSDYATGTFSVSFSLPPEMFADYLFSPLNAYLTIVGDIDSHEYCYSKEAANLYGQPYLAPNLHFIMPEPTALAMLLFAVMPILRRRRTS